MALVLNATAADPAANAYCLTAEADAYHLSRGFNPEWTAALTGAKELAIVWATRLLDQLEWNGIKWHLLPGSQALRWPRAGVFDQDNVLVDYQSIPQWLKNATAEWAFFLIKDDRTLDPGGIVPLNLKVGPIELKNLQRNPVPASVLEIIRPYLRYTPGGNELVRA